ncbi:hypothetical protein SynMVIR181_01578 [Synechococcus sp. MVIR-18-1]|nr:hypothetical protein SynMVIR181_01578 [Synechococcus sp. MVIR-18-1]
MRAAPQIIGRPFLCLDKLRKIWSGDASQLGFWLLGIEALVS